MEQETPERYFLSPDAVYTDLDADSGVALHLGAKRYYTLNGTGVYLWKQLEAHPTGRTQTELLHALIADYEVTPEDAAPTLADFLGDLQAEQLVRTAGGLPGKS